ncbi:MAG: hypothetical protein K2I68_04635 [Bacteroidales bacterium]|nr:hypothetical protein [Bacteroidales bacterium]
MKSKTSILAAVLMGTLWLTGCRAPQKTEDMATLNLTQEWDKKLPKSEKV